MPSRWLAITCGRRCKASPRSTSIGTTAPNAKLTTADIVQQMEIDSQKPGVVARKDGDVAKALDGRRQEDRGRVRAAVSRPRGDGADELHRACAGRRLRHLGRESRW